MNINGYELIGNLHNDKSGYAKWGFARKNGLEVFIKEFLSPVYPTNTNEISEEQIQRKRNICDTFERGKREFYGELSKCQTGNIIVVREFFRNGSRYYIVTEKVDAASISVHEVARLGIEQKILICKIVLHNISALHSHNIVHGDIKPDNILLKRTARGAYTAKVIDFDSGFLESAAPKAGDDLQGDMVYLSPEAFMFIANESGALTKKLDIFSLGILFHQYFCGETPGFDRDNYDYLFEAVLDDGEIRLNDGIPEDFKKILRSMLSKNPEERPEAGEILQMLQSGVNGVGRVEAPQPIYTPIVNSGTTSGSMLKNTMRRPAGADTPVADPEPILRPIPAPLPKKETKGFFKRANDLL